MTRRYEVGDGDECPVNPAHGRMLFLKGSNRQVCTDQSHDGRPGMKGDATRSLWPQGHTSLAEAIRTYVPVVETPFNRDEPARIIPPGVDNARIKAAKDVTPALGKAGMKARLAELAESLDEGDTVLDISAMEV